LDKMLITPSTPHLKYAVVDQRKDREGDTFVKTYKSKQEAVEHAESQWNHLTKSEQKVRNVTACVWNIENLEMWDIFIQYA